MKNLFILFILVVCIFSSSASVNQEKKLRVFLSTRIPSHYLPFLPIANELSKRGHQVTIAIPDPIKNAFPLIPNVKYVTLNPMDAESPAQFDRIGAIFSSVPDYWIPFFQLGFAMYNRPSKDPSSDYSVVLNYIKALDQTERPDLFLIDYFALNSLDVADTLGIPTSFFISFLGPELLTPNGVSAFPKGYLPFPVKNMTYQQTVTNIIVQKLGVYLIGLRIWGVSRYFAHNLPIITSFDQLYKDRLVIMQTVPEYSPSEPLPDRFVYIGASRLSEESLLDYKVMNKPSLASEVDRINHWLDQKHSDGVSVVYVAFGSIWSPSSEHLLGILDGVVSEKRAILISLKPHLQPLLDNSTIPIELRESNIYAADWIQQQTVLNHPAIKIFFTHGGLNSIMESTMAGVPLICRPIMTDQPYNCQRIRDLEIGVSLPRRTPPSKELIENAVKQIEANYDTLHANAKRIGNVFANGGGAVKAVDKLEAYHVNGLDGPDGWKSDHLSWGQQNVNLISYGITAMVLLVFYINPGSENEVKDQLEEDRTKKKLKAQGIQSI
ncbi:hypothetical protein HK098_007799 [Nowakowskiella sp. JEL0407]|nr:hypothetical protein HK098_007799 [Nowakowskiella sp. JEL0407]